MSKEIFNKEPQKYNLALAEELKKIPEFKAPDWAAYVKTSSAKQRVPEDEDFWFKRTASILRQLYIKGVAGTGKLRTRYGARKNRGTSPARFRKASGKIIRTILQQAESANLVEKIDAKQHGRRLTQHGRQFLDDIQVRKEKETQSKKDENVITKNSNKGGLDNSGDDKLGGHVKEKTKTGKEK